MTNPVTSYGLAPIQTKIAADWRNSVNVYYVPASTTNAMYVGDPVIKLAASADVNGINGVNLAAAGSANRITGVIVGFQGKGSTQLGNYNPGSLFGLSGTPGPAYKPANDASAWYVLVNDDPNTLYAIQSNDSGGVPASTIVGKNANLASGAGSVYTGWSGWQLAANSVGTSSSAQLNIVGVLPEADNVAGSASAKFLVRINQDTEVNAATGI
jgi:hypothetical protein